jgi:hypothetical protein
MNLEIVLNVIPIVILVKEIQVIAQVVNLLMPHSKMENVFVQINLSEISVINVKTIIIENILIVLYVKIGILKMRMDFVDVILQTLILKRFLILRFIIPIIIKFNKIMQWAFMV